MVEKKEIEGIVIFETHVFHDERGYFMEFYNEKKFKKNILENLSFKQDNISCSKKNVLRGMHFQLPPFEQGKLVQVIKGKALDVVVDLRKGSKTFGEHLRIELSGNNKKKLWIPPGFAHGFLSLENDTILSYKCTNYYSKDHEMDLLWNDENLNIDWGIENPIISEKDKVATKFENFNSPF